MHALVAAAAIHGACRRVLCLGVGAGVVPLAVLDAFPHAVVDAVDLDPEVIAVAREWFCLSRGEGERLRLHVADARSFLRQARSTDLRWDVVLQDVFDRDYVPADLMSTEFLRELGAALDERGLVAINTFGQGVLHARELATYAQAFAAFFEISAGSNRVIVAYPGPMPDDAVVYENLRGHAAALRHVGIDAEVIAAGLRPTADWPEDTLPFTDASIQEPGLAALRRSAINNPGDVQASVSAHLP
jgi:spermidine synthase